MTERSIIENEGPNSVKNTAAILSEMSLNNVAGIKVEIKYGSEHTVEKSDGRELENIREHTTHHKALRAVKENPGLTQEEFREMGLVNENSASSALYSVWKKMLVERKKVENGMHEHYINGHGELELERVE